MLAQVVEIYWPARLITNLVPLILVIGIFDQGLKLIDRLQASLGSEEQRRTCIGILVFG